jgi:hypothetical protein
MNCHENCLIISAAFFLSKMINGIQTLPGTWQGNQDFDSNPYQVYFNRLYVGCPVDDVPYGNNVFCRTKSTFFQSQYHCKTLSHFECTTK